MFMLIHITAWSMVLRGLQWGKKARNEDRVSSFSFSSLSTFNLSKPCTNFKVNKIALALCCDWHCLHMSLKITFISLDISSDRRLNSFKNRNYHSLKYIFSEKCFSKLLSFSTINFLKCFSLHWFSPRLDFVTVTKTFRNSELWNVRIARPWT